MSETGYRLLACLGRSTCIYDLQSCRPEHGPPQWRQSLDGIPLSLKKIKENCFRYIILEVFMQDKVLYGN